MTSATWRTASPSTSQSEAGAGARAVASDASRRAPVRTGALARSITGWPPRTGIVAGSGLRYAPIQEARRHFMAAAVTAQQATVVAAMAGGVRRLLGRVKGA